MSPMRTGCGASIAAFVDAADTHCDLTRDKPIIGQWWRPADLLTLADAHNLSLTVHYQDRQSPNHYFRYDAVLRSQP